MKVVVTHWVHPEVHGLLGTVATVRAPDEPGSIWSRAEVVAEAAEADALVTSMADAVDEDLVAACPRLRIVAATLKGYDNYDADACTRHGVWLTTVPDVIIEPTAELTLGLTLALLRNVRRGDETVRWGGYEGWRPRLYGTSLRGATVAIVGMGALGAAIAELLVPFGIERLLSVDDDPTHVPGALRDRHERVDLATAMGSADVVVVALPLTGSTHRLVDAVTLAPVRPGAYLVNVGRGSVVDEDAVLAALEDGRLAGYAADVFAMEDWALPTRPDAVGEGLRTHPRTVFTPHLGSAVDAVRREMSLTAARQVIDVLNGGRPEHAVNEPAGSSSAVER